MPGQAAQNLAHNASEQPTLAVRGGVCYKVAGDPPGRGAAVAIGRGEEKWRHPC